MPIGAPTGKLHPSSVDFVPEKGAGDCGDDNGSSDDDDSAGNYAAGLFLNQDPDFVPPVQRVFSELEYMTPDGVAAVAALANTARHAAQQLDGFTDLNQKAGGGISTKRMMHVAGIGEVEVYDDTQLNMRDLDAGDEIVGRVIEA